MDLKCGKDTGWSHESSVTCTHFLLPVKCSMMISGASLAPAVQDAMNRKSQGDGCPGLEEEHKEVLWKPNS